MKTFVVETVSVPRRGSADGATAEYEAVLEAAFAFQSPEGVVLTVQLVCAPLKASFACVSVPRRGSADGATVRLTRFAKPWKKFQSPEGVVLTVQPDSSRASSSRVSGFSPPKG